MTDQQLDDLVARIGDELLTRLGVVSSPPVAHACACDGELLTAPAPASAAGWVPAKIGLNCRESFRTSAEISARCLQARTLGLGAVSVFPSQVVAAGRVLRRTDVRIAVAVGWPHGATSTAAKALEAELALGQGADAACAAAGLSAYGSASAEAVRLFRKVVGQDIQVHAAGEVASEAATLELAAAGADRVTIDFLPGDLRGTGRS